MSHKLTWELFEAYCETTYWVEFPGRESIPIRIGELHPQLDEWLAEVGVNRWAFITAYHPFSQQSLTPAENQERLLELQRELHGRGRPVWQGEGIGSGGEWPPEPSLLVGNLSETDAMSLGRQYEQNAVVVGARETEAWIKLCFPEGFREEYEAALARLDPAAPLVRFAREAMQSPPP